MGASLWIYVDFLWIRVDFLHVDWHLYFYYLQGIARRQVHTDNVAFSFFSQNYAFPCFNTNLNQIYYLLSKFVPL